MNAITSRRFLATTFGVAAAFFVAAAPAAPVVADAQALAEIARAIEALKIRQPALAEFSAAKNLDADNQKITYAFHTHAASARGGWTAGVPNPDEDGIWFYIDLHDAASTAQIHTQPMGPKLCLGEQHVSFLSLAGDRVRELDREISKILRRNGVAACAVTSAR